MSDAVVSPLIPHTVRFVKAFSVVCDVKLEAFQA